MRSRTAAAEEAALAVPGVTNSDGADASWSRYEIALAGSNGFAGAYARTSHSISTTAVVGTGTGMERDYDWSSTVHLADLDDPVAIGRRAAEQAVRRLNPTRPKTARIPVVFDPRVAGSLLGHLSGAINGSAVARGRPSSRTGWASRCWRRGWWCGMTRRGGVACARAPSMGKGCPGKAASSSVTAC